MCVCIEWHHTYGLATPYNSGIRTTSKSQGTPQEIEDAPILKQLSLPNSYKREGSEKKYKQSDEHDHSFIKFFLAQSSQARTEKAAKKLQKILRAGFEPAT